MYRAKGTIVVQFGFLLERVSKMLLDKVPWWLERTGSLFLVSKCPKLVEHGTY
jgi:hypothetical protein